MPVQYSYTSTPPMGHASYVEPQCLYSRAITLLPPMGHTAYTEPQCLYSIDISLLPLWTVRPLQSLSACTVELYIYSPMGRTACTELQCLYIIAIPLLPYGPYGLYRASVPVEYSYNSPHLWAVRPVQSLSACIL